MIVSLHAVQQKKMHSVFGQNQQLLTMSNSLLIEPLYQGSKLTVASNKFATGKSHLLPAKNVSSKRLLPGNSVIQVITWKNKPIFTEIFLLLIRPHTIPYGQRHYQCL